MTTNTDQEPAAPATAPADGGPRKVPATLIEAVRAELIALAQGDLEENLKPIADVVLRAGELFVAIRGAEARALRGGSPYGGASTNIMSATPMAMGAQLVGSSVSYSNPEQFGASAIRQLVSLVPEILAAKSNAPDRLMKAIAIAKKEGHVEIAAALTKRLLGDEAPEIACEHDHKPGEKANGKKNGAPLLPGASP